MSGATLWGYVHISLLVVWLVGEIGITASMIAIRRARVDYEKRARALKFASATSVVPRVCLVLLFPVGVELTGAINVYPLTPGLQTAAWVISGVWLVVIFAHIRAAGLPAAATLRHIHLFLEAIAGLGFVVYGLNSLATGAPIDEPWFAAKLFLVGLVFWGSIGIDLCFRPFFAPFSETKKYGATPEREEAILRAVDQTIVALVVLYALLAAITFFALAKPF